uniref:Uncharacterized protein n=1 Tax=Octopus bimaculoides TaxID=37653 RepID=A0A0L8IHH0_OCTBM
MASEMCFKQMPTVPFVVTLPPTPATTISMHLVKYLPPVKPLFSPQTIVPSLLNVSLTTAAIFTCAVSSFYYAVAAAITTPAIITGQH